MRQGILSLLFFTLLLPSLGMAEAILGCDFDSDGKADKVVSSGCRANELDVIYCKQVTITLSSAKSKTSKQIINFQDNKNRARRAFTNFICEDRDQDGDTGLYAINKLLVQERIKEVQSKPSIGLDAVCKSTRELKSCEVWTSQASSHIPGADPRAGSTSFIGIRGCPGGFPSCIQGFDSQGNSLHSLGEYFPTGSDYDNRHYGGYGCGDGNSPRTVAGLAKAKTGNTSLYLKDSSGVCVRIPDPSRCYNSSGC